MDVTDLTISLLSIDEQSDMCRFDRRALKRMTVTELGVNLAGSLVPDRSASTIKVILRVELRPADDNAARGISLFRARRDTLVTYAVAATFAMADFDHHVIEIDDGLRVATPALKLMLSVTLGALRGMLAQRLRDMHITMAPLPLIDLSDLTQQFSAE